MKTNKNRIIEQGHGGKKGVKIPFDIKKTKGHVVGFKIAIKSEVLSIGVFHRPLDQIAKEFNTRYCNCHVY